MLNNKEANVKLIEELWIAFKKIVSLHAKQQTLNVMIAQEVVNRFQKNCIFAC